MSAASGVDGKDIVRSISCQNRFSQIADRPNRCPRSGTTGSDRSRTGLSGA